MKPFKPLPGLILAILAGLALAAGATAAAVNTGQVVRKVQGRWEISRDEKVYAPALASHGPVRGTGVRTGVSTGVPFKGPQAGTARLVAPHPGVEAEGEGESEEGRVLLRPGPAGGKVPRPTSPQESQLKHAARAASDLTVFRSSKVASGAAGDLTSTLSEPNVANDRNAILYTANQYAAMSFDNGLSWSKTSTGTVFGDSLDGGWCCDQLAHSVDRGSYSNIFWITQYFADSHNNHLRIALYPNGDAMKDNSGCSVLVDPQDVGWNDKTWFDFPQVAATDKWLYVSANAFATDTGLQWGATVMRFDIDDFNSGCTGNKSISVTRQSKNFTLANSPSFAGGDSDTMYFAYLGTLSQISMFKWDDGDSSYTNTVRGIDAFPYTMAGSGKCETKNGANPCESFDARIITGAWADGHAYWAWNADQGGDYPFPHVRLVDVKTSTMKVSDQAQWHSDDHAVVYPALTVNSRGGIGATYYRIGGDVDYERARVALIDSDGGTFGDPDTKEVHKSTQDPNNDGNDNNHRWGDYGGVAAYTGCANTYAAGTEALTSSPGKDDDAENKFVWFGRERDGCADLATTTVNIGWTTTATTASTVLPGDKLKVTDEVQNQGGVAAQGTVTRYYLSKDTSKSSADLLLSPSGAHVTLNPGASDTWKTKDITVPSDAKGYYYVLSCADDTGLVDEVTTANNCLASADTIRVAAQISPGDLNVTSVSFSASRGVKAGASVTIKSGYQFLPKPDTKPKWEINLYLIRSYRIDATMKYLGGLHLPSTPPRIPTPFPNPVTPAPVRSVFTVPASVRPGAYRLMACQAAAGQPQGVDASSCYVTARRLYVLPARQG